MIMLSLLPAGTDTEDALSAALLSYTQLLRLLPTHDARHKATQHVRQVLVLGSTSAPSRSAHPSISPHNPTSAPSNTQPDLSELQAALHRCSISSSAENIESKEGCGDEVILTSRPSPSQTAAALCMLAAYGHAQCREQEGSERAHSDASLDSISDPDSHPQAAVAALAAKLLLCLVPSSYADVSGPSAAVGAAAAAAAEQEEACHTVSQF